MNNLVANPIGVDKVINRLQTFIYDQIILKTSWNPIQAYGRVYKNKIEGGIIPQFYKGEGEYQKDVFITDKAGNVGNIFFSLEDKHKYLNVAEFSVETKIIFMLNLKLIYNDSDQRQDSKAQRELFNIVNKKNQFTITRLETGLETVLKGFDLTGVKKVDLEPLHIFAFVGDLKYNINKC